MNENIAPKLTDDLPGGEVLIAWREQDPGTVLESVVVPQAVLPVLFKHTVKGTQLIVVGDTLEVEMRGADIRF